MAGLTNAHVDAGTGFAYPNSQGANWSAKASWAAWTKWDANPYTSIEYIHETDVGLITQLSPMVGVSADADSYTVQESHSTDGSSWSSYASLGAVFTARHVRIKVVATGDYPILKDVSISLLTERREKLYDDLDTSTLTGNYRIGTGVVRLNATGFTVVTAVLVSFQNVGAGYTWELIDKTITYGPRIKIYDSTGALADATIDAILRGA
jgi:hypothetical protein